MFLPEQCDCHEFHCPTNTNLTKILLFVCLELFLQLWYERTFYESELSIDPSIGAIPQAGIGRGAQLVRTRKKFFFCFLLLCQSRRAFPAKRSFTFDPGCDLWSRSEVSLLLLFSFSGWLVCASVRLLARRLRSPWRNSPKTSGGPCAFHERGGTRKAFPSAWSESTSSLCNVATGGGGSVACVRVFVRYLRTSCFHIHLFLRLIRSPLKFRRGSSQNAPLLN